MRMFKSSKIYLTGLFVFLVSFLFPLEGWGQGKTITIQVFSIPEGKTEKDKTIYSGEDGLNVYGFYEENKAKTFYNKRKDSSVGEFYLPDPNDYDVLTALNDEGFCTMRLPLTGWAVIDPPGADPMIKQVDKKTLQIEFLVKEERSATGGKDVDIIAKVRGPQPPPIPKACGNKIVVDGYLKELNSEDVNTLSRVMLLPIVKTFNKKDTLLHCDTVGFLPPYVKEGVKFRKAKIRRLGFKEEKDPLFPYIEGRNFEESHKKDYILVSYELYPVDTKRYRYQVDADELWCRNIPEPYKIDSICLGEGYLKEPMRFLDYDMVEVPINRTLYSRRGQAKLNNDHETLNLNFVVGKAQLVETDTANFVQLDKLKGKLARYHGDDSGITGATIHGSASPEGGIAFNERICRERANFLRNELSAFPALQDAKRAGTIKITAKVATWSDVANQLEKDSLKEESALVLNAIKGISDAGNQERKIRTLPCWKLIEERILPKFRYVDIEYEYYTNRVKTRAEILKEYRTIPEYHEGKLQQPYEFYELLDLLKDPKEKEPIALAAYESVKDIKIKNPQRNWPLAAYELAKCYLERDHIDTTLLLPYLRPMSESALLENHNRANGRYNDPAIVTMHINMLCRANDFAKAYTCAYQCLPDIPQYRKLRMFLRCLNCEWDVREVKDTVMNSSYWNKIVVLIAQEDKVSRSLALKMLDDKDKVNQADPKTLYLKAQLLYDLYPSNKTNTGKDRNGKDIYAYVDKNFMFDEYYTPSTENPYISSDDLEPFVFWGLPMAQCCAIDESFYEIMLWDGEFNEDYRKAFKAYWKKVKSGQLPKPMLPEPTAQHRKQTMGTEKDVMDSLLRIDE